MSKQFIEVTFEQKLAAIGIMISTAPLTKKQLLNVDIERTLAEVFCDFDRMPQSLRLFGPILTWIEVHGSSIIIEKLIKILLERKREGEDTSAAALFAKFAISKGHKRWHTVVKKFLVSSQKQKVIGPPDMVESFIRLKGEETWAKKSGFRVASGTVKTHLKWVLSRKALAQHSHQYRNRLIYGAQWRADIITVYEKGARTPAEASRLSGASYEPCYRVKVELDAAGKLVS